VPVTALLQARGRIGGMRTGVLVLVVAATVVTAAGGAGSTLSDLQVGNGDGQFAGDRSDLATVSPNGDGRRDAATIAFHLGRAAAVTLQAVVESNRETPPRQVYERTVALGAGDHRLRWRPGPDLEPRTYRVRLLADGAEATSVVRVLGIDAGFGRPGYRPGVLAGLAVTADAKRLTLQLFQAGPERRPTIYSGYGNEELHGVPAGPARTIDWSRHRLETHVLRLRVPHRRSGLYFVRLRAGDGRVGFAPFVLLPRRLGRHRVAVVFPTNTWQAYNHRDVDGDGTGDTWYADNTVERVDLTRPYLHRGVPTRFRGYELGFLRWLYVEHKRVDFITDRQLDRIGPRRLRRLYDLVVFLGHHEYMTTHAYDTTTGFRDLGGRLLFSSTTNFLYRVEHRGRWLYRKEPWRELGRPEAALIGAQYLSNDFGEHQGRYDVVGAAAAPWAFRGTGLGDGDTFGHGGIEIDGRSAASPPGTVVLATMHDLHGPGLSAEMTYYETPVGARVFAAGTLNFAGTALEPPVSALLENVWRRLAS